MTDNAERKYLTTEESLAYVGVLEDKGFDLHQYEHLKEKWLTKGFLPSLEALELWNYRKIIEDTNEEFGLK